MVADLPKIGYGSRKNSRLTLEYGTKLARTCRLVLEQISRLLDYGRSHLLERSKRLFAVVTRQVALRKCLLDMSETNPIDLPAVVPAKDTLSDVTGYSDPIDNTRKDRKWHYLTLASFAVIIIVAILAVGV